VSAKLTFFEGDAKRIIESLAAEARERLRRATAEASLELQRLSERRLRRRVTLVQEDDVLIVQPASVTETELSDTVERVLKKVVIT